jgi:hypothetical protein
MALKLVLEPIFSGFYAPSYGLASIHRLSGRVEVSVSELVGWRWLKASVG